MASSTESPGNEAPAGSSRVVVASSPDTLRLETRPVPALAADEALVRVHECGLCGSDLKLLAGRHPVVKPPMVLGHEFHGTVEAVGTAAGSLGPGQAVAGFPPVGCGHCFNCLRGWPHLCEAMRFLGGELQGGLSELVAVPAANLAPIDASVPAERRVLIEPLAVGVHAVRRGEVAPEARALVIGAGPIGIFTALALRHCGVEHIVLADLSDDRLALAQRLGLGDTVNTRDVALADHVRERVRPEGVDVAFDCVGLEATARDALALTCKGGRAVLIGLMPSDLRVDGVLLQRGERALIGVQQYVREDFSTAMAILAGGALPASEELVRSYPLERAADAFADLRGGSDVLKVAVRPLG